ncbi:uncharacterized protein LOC131875495 isoform X2 [Cryptomeria japonica]|uniref:uncharacterized protein LOC131875495 isoform X2 n=1 Tax=Cryptomeria japonica TaxID=3369 RepID=UPI0027DA69BC|nr:uncharacterized protein LOC131875495 isoform X2 [Cryptomeria japonica]
MEKKGSFSQILLRKSLRQDMDPYLGLKVSLNWWRWQKKTLTDSEAKIDCCTKELGRSIGYYGSYFTIFSDYFHMMDEFEIDELLGIVPPPPPPPPDHLRQTIRTNIDALIRDIHTIRCEPHPPPQLLRLADSMQGIVQSMQVLDSELDSYRSWREGLRAFYADGLTYKQVIDLKITKIDLKKYFVNPKTGEEIDPKKSWISIRWCRHSGIASHFWERWLMVFDHPPHSNHEVSMYFLKKLWVEFELGKKPNYFDIRSFQGVGRGMPQDRPRAKLSDRVRNHVRDDPLVPLPSPVVPASAHYRAVDSVLGSLSALSDNLVQQLWEVRAAPCLAHVCTSCGNVCRGPQSEAALGGDGDFDDADAAHGGYDDAEEAAHADAVSSYVDLLWVDDDQPRERMDHTTSLRNQQHVTSIPRDVGAPFTGASCSTEVGSSSCDPWTTEAQPHIPLASGLFDGASHVHTTTNIGTAMGLSQMQPSTLSFEDLATTTFLVHDSGPPRTSEGIVEHGRMTLILHMRVESLILHRRVETLILHRHMMVHLRTMCSRMIHLNHLHME